MRNDARNASIGLPGGRGDPHSCLIIGAAAHVRLRFAYPTMNTTYFLRVATALSCLLTCLRAEMTSPSPVWQAANPVIPAKTFKVTDYGAVPGDEHDDTAAFTRAIAAVESAGGGA